MKPTLILMLALATGGSLFASEPTEAERLFTLKVKPLFSEKCNGCHGDDPDKIKGEFSMLSLDEFLIGGEYYGKDVLVPGHADKSALIEVIRRLDPDWEMPPKATEALSEEEIAIVEDWVNAGAPWPDDAVQTAILDAEKHQLETEDGVIMPTSGGLGDEWTYRRYQPEDVWAFRPVDAGEIPEVEGVTHPIDAFLQSRLADEGFEPAPEADPQTLIRRASYDLIGLPPTAEETLAFVNAWAADQEGAWAQLIDRLLASPAYGERWAQHWLDVARYADTGGMSNDFERSNAWRYRDWVVRALNEDKPYDAFTIEQLAGDELADASVRDRSNGDEKLVHAARLSGDYNEQESEWLVATGFLRMGAWDNAMVMPEEARQIYLDDVVNSVGQTFLATTMRCFKCHDHKFDPLPTKDYYRMYAAFSGTQMAERSVPFLEDEVRDGFNEGKAQVEQLLSFAKEKRDDLIAKREAAAKKWYAENQLDYLPLDQRKDLPDEMKPARGVGLSPEEEGRLKVREQDVWIWERRLERYQPLAQSVYNAPGITSKFARKLRIPKTVEDKGTEDFILTGGALEAKGDPVVPGVISSLGVPVNPDAEDPYLLPSSVEGRRLALAQWIANPENPLTSRAFVNRVWQHHFVNPIARNPNNFGVKGAKPSHPELLDWLAANFTSNGWTLKRLHRLIMTSQAYRQASVHPDGEALAAKDPANALLAYYPPRRLSAEEIRDSLLQITGELSQNRGGLPIMPEINMEVALQPRMIQFSLAPAYQPSPTPDLRNRRTVYAYRVRGQADPFLELFNRPNPNDSCEGRDAAVVTPQAFSLMNSDLMTDRSIAFAQRLADENQGFEAQIARAFKDALGRPANPSELDRMARYAAEMADYHSKVEPTLPEYPTEITRSLIEEFSGEPFEYQEILPAFENYQADLKAAEVDANVRALADICLLLMNANEFVYVY